VSADQAVRVVTAPTADPRPARASRSRWWIPLVTGVAWLVVAVVVFRFDYLSVTTVAALFGVVVLFAAANEAASAALATGVWRLVRLLVTVLLVVVAAMAFVDPGGTFASLAAVMSFYFVVTGALDISTALAVGRTARGLGLLLAAGVAEVLIGFWAAGSWAASVTTLVAFVGGAALLRGVAGIVWAFHVLGTEADTG
jgi:uncharacterized membrane protein HdeD (DUF308 family)